MTTPWPWDSVRLRDRTELMTSTYETYDECELGGPN